MVMMMMLVVGEWGCATGPLLSTDPGLSFVTCGLVWLASPDSAWRRCGLPLVKFYYMYRSFIMVQTVTPILPITYG